MDDFEGVQPILSAGQALCERIRLLARGMGCIRSLNSLWQGAAVLEKPSFLAPSGRFDLWSCPSRIREGLPRCASI
jgi:hypothetical protein